jgi:hypothetical protein
MRKGRACPRTGRVLWVGSSLSIIGGQMTTFAVTFQVFQATRCSAPA